MSATVTLVYDAAKIFTESPKSGALRQISRTD